MTKTIRMLLVAAAIAHLSLDAAAQKVSDLPAGTTVGGTEMIPAVQSGSTVRLTPAQLDTYTSATTKTLTNKSISGASNTITNVPISTGVSGLGTGVATALGTAVGSNGAPVVNGGALGTPSSGTATNLTGLPISTGLTGAGSGVITALGVNVGTDGAVVVNGGALGTPSSGTATNLTGLPISTGVSGMGTGMATFLVTPSSANLAAALTDENGSGKVQFSAGTLDIASGKTATISNTLTLTGTDASSVAFGAGGTVGYALVPTAVKTSSYTAAVGDAVRVDTTSGSVTITLPTAPADKSQVAVKQVIRGGTNTVTVAAGGSDVFNRASGPTTLTLTLSGQAVELQYIASGAIWLVITDDLPYGSLLANGNTWTGTNAFGVMTATGLTVTQPAGASDFSTNRTVQTKFQAGDYKAGSFQFIPNTLGQRPVEFVNFQRIGGLPGSYIDSIGAWNTQANILASGHSGGFSNPDGVVLAPSNEPNVIAAWSDVNGPTIESRVNIGDTLERNYTARDVNGNAVFNVGPNGELSWAAGGAANTSTYTSRDAFLLRRAAATMQFGAADVASGAVAQIVTFQGNTASTTNGPLAIIRGAGGGSSTSVGGELRLSGGLSSAAGGTGGAITFYTAPASAGNVATLALTLAADKTATFTGAASFGGGLTIPGASTFAVGAASYASTFLYIGSNSASIQLGVSADARLTYLGAGSIQLGASDAATAVAQTIRSQGVVTGTTNTAGANLSIDVSPGSGTGAGGSFIVRVAPAGSTGSTQNALATALTIDSTKLATFAGAASFGGGLTIPGASTFAVGAASYASTFLYIGSNSASIQLGVAADARLTYLGAGSIQQGAADVASGAIAQLLTFQGNTGSTTNGPVATIRGAGGGSSTSVGGELRLSGGLPSAAAGTGGAVTIYSAVSGAGTTPVSLANFSTSGLTFGTNLVTPASSGTRYLCISTAGVVTSSASACSGT